MKFIQLVSIEKADHEQQSIRSVHILFEEYSNANFPLYLINVYSTLSINIVLFPMFHTKTVHISINSLNQCWIDINRVRMQRF